MIDIFTRPRGLKGSDLVIRVRPGESPPDDVDVAVNHLMCRWRKQDGTQLDNLELAQVRDTLELLLELGGSVEISLPIESDQEAVKA